MDACSKCGKPIHAFHTKVYPVQGYEKSRGGAGGQNHVLRKQRVDGWLWHERCWEDVMRERDGRGIQERLI